MVVKVAAKPYWRCVLSHGIKATHIRLRSSKKGGSAHWCAKEAFRCGMHLLALKLVRRDHDLEDARLYLR
jgi:hypothetical protein